jgi:hypothetical protein
MSNFGGYYYISPISILYSIANMTFLILINIERSMLIGLKHLISSPASYFLAPFPAEKVRRPKFTSDPEQLLQTDRSRIAKFVLLLLASSIHRCVRPSALLVARSPVVLLVSARQFCSRLPGSSSGLRDENVRQSAQASTIAHW